MREVVLGTQFKRDLKLSEKRGKNLAKMRELILLLEEGNSAAALPGSCFERRLEAFSGLPY